MGKPSTYDEAMVKDILERLSEGTPLAEICRDEGMPHPTTFRRWVDAEHELDGELLGIAYARAREDGFDQIALDALRIADDSTYDTKMVGGGGESEPRETANAEWISRSKLRVETRLKLLAKWDPKRYGDRTLVGSDPENPLPSGFAVNLVKSGNAAS